MGICVILVVERWIYAWINQFLKEKYTMKYMSGNRAEAINPRS